MSAKSSSVACLLQEASTAGIKVTRKSMGCRELKDRMLLGSTLVIALVDKTRLAGHGGHAAGQKAVSLGMSVRMMLAPGYYTGEAHSHQQAQDWSRVIDLMYSLVCDTGNKPGCA